MKKKMKGSKKKSSTGSVIPHAHQEVHVHFSAADGNEADRAIAKLKYKNFKG